MPVPSEELFADTRTVQQANGSLSIVIPSELVKRYEIDAGEEVLWFDDGNRAEPRFIPPGAQDTSSAEREED